MFQGAVETSSFPWAYQIASLNSAKHDGAAARAMLQSGWSVEWQSTGWRATSCPKGHLCAESSCSADNSLQQSSSVWDQYFQNRFVFVLFNPLLLKLVCSFILQWKEVKKYLFKKTCHLPLSHYSIYRGTDQLSQSVSVVLPQAHTCFDLTIQMSWALIAGSRLRLNTTSAVPSDPMRLSHCSEGETEEHERCWQSVANGGEHPAISHPSQQHRATGPCHNDAEPWGESPIPLRGGKEGFGELFVLHDSAEKGGKFALTGTQMWRTSLLHMDMSQSLGLLLQGSHLLVRSGCSFFQILVLFQLCHTETIFSLLKKMPLLRVRPEFGLLPMTA